RLLDAGIDDWGGVSPVTIDHVNPEAPWPELERLREATRARGLELAPRLPVYPEWIDGAWLDPTVMPHVLRASDSLGLAREDDWSPGETSAVPFIPSNRLLLGRGALPVDSRDELVRRVEEAWARGATEVCLQGGIHPAFTGDYYDSVVRTIKDAVPDMHVHAFSALEVWQGAATLGVPLDDYLRRLRASGLGS